MGSRSKVLVMGGRLHLVAFTAGLVLFTSASATAEEPAAVGNRHGAGRAFSLFSIVQFPNAGCTASSSSTTYGTCYTATECTEKGGSADGNCASGFGVCCLITTNTCGSTVSTNTSYIRNPNYPSSYTPTSTGSCEIKVSKCSDDVCQLRADFQTMSGFAASVGVCSDKFTAEGQTGVNPPSVCGTNTDYHMYTEFGATSTDTITLTITYGSTTTAKTWNVLLRQISCTATWKAPTDCVQYFTGATGTIQSYNFAGAQLLNSMYYNNCIRTEAGYCKIQYKESTGQTPDTFGLKASSGNAEASAGGCPASFLFIPNLSSDGINALTIPASTESFISFHCGGVLGLDGTAVSLALTSVTKPFLVGVYTDTTTALTSPTTGFSLDYTQLPC